MEYLVTSFLVVFPLFIKLLIGYGLRKTRLMGTETFREMNNVTFRLFLPVLIFSNIYQADLSKAVSPRLIVYAVSSLLVLFFIAMTIVPRLEPDNRRRGVLVQAVCRSNFILFGLPVAITLYGSGSAGTASILVGIVVPVINTLSVIALEYFRGERPDIRKIIHGIVYNPIIIGALFGLTLVLTGIKLPPVLEKIISEIAAIATPLALIVLGGSVTFKSLGRNRWQLILGSMTRLVFVPFVGLTIAILMGFRDVELVILMAMFSSPAAVSSYTMAQQMDGDAELAGQLVIFTTVFSILTIFCWIFLLMALRFV